MAANGDSYVQFNGPTTVVENGQRYLDYPSLPLIPTYTVDPSGAVDPLGTVEGVDPNLGEVLLDFSTMAPLPHDQQRPGEVGSGVTDLLGIAPGAQYRLVEPSQPTFANIAAALLAAAQQTAATERHHREPRLRHRRGRLPRPLPRRRPLIRSVISTIVNQYGIVVTISSNDGTRLYTPAAVGPDGGSTPTNLPRHGRGGDLHRRRRHQHHAERGPRLGRDRRRRLPPRTTRSRSRRRPAARSRVTARSPRPGSTG